MEDNTDRASFVFKKYLVKSSSLRITSFTPDPNMSLNLDLEVKIEDNENISELTMHLRLKDVSESFSMVIDLAGYFEAVRCIPEKRAEFMCKNAPAILFPYLRAFVSSVTAQAGLTPIIMPTINLVRKGEELLERLHGDKTA